MSLSWRILSTSGQGGGGGYLELSTVWGRQRYILPMPAHTRMNINRRWWSLSMFPSLSLDDMTTMVTMHDTATMLRTTLTTDLIKSFLMTDKTVANVVKKIPFYFKFDRPML